MQRSILRNLTDWLEASGRKPLILRGARQTGKTYVVRQLAKASNRKLIELNFEKEPDMSKAFESNDPKLIVSMLEMILGEDISPESSILFLDEIQECAFILAKLRWFYEEMPELPVIAAGSLLEFALGDYEDSMPVGRVTYRYMHPFTFEEFLWALGETKIADFVFSSGTRELPEIIHTKCVELYRQYCIVGGMPAVVKKWVETGRLADCIQLQKDLLNSFRDDFHKYRKNVSADILKKTMESVVYQLGSTFKYTSVDRNVRQPEIKKAFELLEKAGICKSVYQTSANGIPLGSEKNERIFKAVFLDVGLAMAVSGFCPMDISQLEEVVWSNKGAIAEQTCGQLLIAKHEQDDDDMFFWQQTGSGTGEIDYVIQRDNSVLPVEVKAGKAGTMKSLHAFMFSKKLKKALRFDLNVPSVQEINVKTNHGENVEYTLETRPLYMV